MYVPPFLPNFAMKQLLRRRNGEDEEKIVAAKQVGNGERNGRSCKKCPPIKQETTAAVRCPPVRGPAYS